MISSPSATARPSRRMRARRRIRPTAAFRWSIWKPQDRVEVRLRVNDPLADGGGRIARKSGITVMKTRSLGIAFAALLAFAPVRGSAQDAASSAAPAKARRPPPARASRRRRPAALDRAEYRRAGGSVVRKTPRRARSAATRAIIIAATPIGSRSRCYWPNFIATTSPGAGLPGSTGSEARALN